MKFLLFFVTCSAILPAHAQEKLPLWIWSKAEGGDGEVVHFRKQFKADAGDVVRLAATCDNEMTVFLNGKQVAESKDWK